MRRGSVLYAFNALTVHFQPVAAHSEARSGSGLLEHILRVASFQFIRRSAFPAQQVMVVPLAAELVAQFMILQQDPAYLTGSPPTGANRDIRWLGRRRAGMRRVPRR